MKILHTIPYFNKGAGGPTSCVYNLVRGINNACVQTDILTFSPPKDDYIGKEDFIHYLPDDRFTPLWFSKNFKRTLIDHIEDYDVLHINTIWTWPSHLPINIAKRNRKPIVISPHGMLYPQALKVSSWKKTIISNLFLKSDLTKIDCLHATSLEEARFIRQYGVKKPIAVISNCIDIDSFPKRRTQSNQIRRFGYVGRLHPIKNVDVLLEAWKQLEKQTNGCELLIIGDGNPDYVGSLKNFVKSNNLTNIKFTGFQSGDDLKDLVKSLDYQLLISKSENFGMVIPEALACGVPVITTKGAPWEMVKANNCGWWIDADVATIKETILDAMNLPEDKRLEMGLNGQKLVTREFSSKEVASKMIELYSWLLGETNRTPDFVYED